MSMIRKEYSPAKLAKALGSYRTTIQTWMNKGYIMPSIRTANGKGSAALFNEEDLRLAKIFKALLMAGFSRSSAAPIAQSMRGKDINEIEIRVNVKNFNVNFRGII